MNALPDSILEQSTAQLVRWCQSQGEPAFRAKQIQHWIFPKRAESFEAMHDLPARLRSALAQSFRLFSTTEVRHQLASDGTEKLLLSLADDNNVECVLMREPTRRTICISTQVGCAMGCVFCASGLLGLKRNLSIGEILEQVLRLDRLLPPGERITNVVVMGLGEPLANLTSLLPALEHVCQHEGLGLSPRRITISTVGLPEKIRELARAAKPYNLAISLHAPNDRLRNEIVPVNRNIGLTALLDAADDYFRETGRRVTYEYVLLRNINDSPEHARELAGLLRNRNAHVNLIPMNSIEGLTFGAPRREEIRQFIAILEASGTAATVRKRKGADIDAACGQLRLQHERGHAASVAQVP